MPGAGLLSLRRAEQHVQQLAWLGHTGPLPQLPDQPVLASPTQQGHPVGAQGVCQCLGCAQALAGPSPVALELWLLTLAK